MGTKKHGSKKEVLSENSKKEPQKLTWKSKYEQICATHVTNGTDENDAKEEDETKSNALDGLSGYLSSDSSSGESELNEEVGNFLKEVDVLFEQAKKQQLANEASRAALAHAQALSKVPTADPTMQQYDQSGAPTVAWQECYDSSTGFTYYWNMETNEVTWDMPPEYQTYMEALKQWQQYQAQGVAALLQARVQQQIQQQHQLLLQQAHEHQQNVAKQKTAEAQHVGRKNKKKLGKKSDSEDEKIELITSYGPFSEEESSDTEKKALKAAKAKKRKNEEKELNAKPMGPMLPKNKIRRINRPLKLLKSSLVPYHPEIDSDVEEPSQSSLPSSALDTEAGPTTEKKLSENHSPVSSPVEIRKDEAESILSKEDDIDEHALLDRLKSQTQVLKELGGEIPDEVKNIIVDDFDKDEVISEEAKACSNMLSEERKNLKLKLSARVKKLINNSTTVKVRTTDFIQSDGLKPAQHKIDEDELDVLNESNDLLSKKKFTRLGIPTSFLSIDSGKSSEVRPREEGSRGGFGFVASKEEKKRNKAERIAFVKADVLHLSEEDKGTDVPEDVEDSGMNVKDVSAVLQDKMRFLSDSKEPVPPVQIWIIQLETLLSAWESKNLKKTYLEDWLNKTRKELETLEGTVAPDGWICEWQRYGPEHQILSTNPSRFPINTTVHSFIISTTVI